jgi:hypothetical protein
MSEDDFSQSEEEQKSTRKSHESPAKKEDRSNPDVVYTQYEPRTVTELREYMFFCISR